MPINGTDLLNNPIDTIFSPFSDFLGAGFWLIPIGFITLALFIKTRNLTAASVWLMGSCIIMGSGQIFGSYPEMSFFYYLVACLGFTGTIVSIFLMRK